MIGGIQIVDLTIRTYIFKVSEYSTYPSPAIKDDKGAVILSAEDQLKQQKEETNNQRKRQFSNSLAMIAIGAPLYLYHWKTIKKES